MPECALSSFLSSLTETIEGLQTYMEDLQTQVDELRTAQLERSKKEQAEQRRSIGAQSVSCLKELYDLQHDRYCMCAFFCTITGCDRATVSREEIAMRTV